MDTFKCGGPGGQKQNKTDSGVRFTHLASGAVGESREERSQPQNKRIAWRRMAQHPKFLAWHKLESARRMGQVVDIETQVKKSMVSANLQVEVVEDGEWVPEH